MANIAVLITVYNRKNLTIKCLKRLQVQSSHLDVFITDGGSTDGTVETIKRDFPDVNIKVEEGLFWNRGMYKSWERASSLKKYDYYLWLNDDVTLYDDCIQTLLAASEENEDKAIIVGATVDTVSKTKLTYGGRIEGKGIAPIDGNFVKVDHFNGNIVLVPSFVYDRLGNLDFYYKHSMGDFDYGIRAKKAGINVYQCGKALGECDEHPRIDKWCDPEIPLKRRLKLLYRPNGMPPHEFFHLEKQINVLKAIFHFFSVHIRCVFPEIWVRMRS